MEENYRINFEVDDALMDASLLRLQRRFEDYMESVSHAGEGVDNVLTSAMESVSSLSRQIAEGKETIADLTDYYKGLMMERNQMLQSGEDVSEITGQINVAKNQLEDAKLSVQELEEEFANAKKEAETALGYATEKAKALGDTIEGTKDETKKLAQEFESTSDAAEALAGKMAAVFTIGAAEQFSKKVMDITSQFQQMEISFTAFMGSQQKANAYIDKALDLAAKGPFSYQDVMASSKALMGFGVEAKDLMKTMTQLGEVASGLSIPIGRIAQVYGMTMTRGKLQTRDLLMYQRAGIPIMDELQKMYGKNRDEIMKMVSAGKIGFNEVKKVFEQMTEEGGRFFGMIEKQSATIEGQMSSVQVALARMFQEIGQQNEGWINKGFEVTEKLIENYKTIGNIIKTIAVAYGIERAALIATIAVKKVSAALDTVSAKGLWASVKASAADTAAKAANTAATRGAAVAQAQLNKAILANPYVLAAAALAGLVYGIVKLVQNANKAKREMKQFNEEMQKMHSDTEARINASYEEEISKINRLKEIAADAAAPIDARNKAIKRLNEVAPGYEAHLDQEGNLIEGNTEKLDAYIEKLKAKIVYEAKEDELKEIIKRKENISKAIEDLDAEVDKFNKKASQYTTPGAFGALSDTNMELMGWYSFRAGRKEAELNQKKAALEALEEDQKQVEADIKEAALQAKDLLDLGLGGSGSGGGGGDDKAAQKILQAQKELTDRSVALQKERVDLEFQIRQGEIDLMADCEEKKRRQAELDFDREMEQIQRQKEAKLKELQHLDFLEQKKNNPNLDEKTFVSSIDENSPVFKEYKDLYSNMEEQAFQKWLATADKNASEYAQKTAELAARKADLEKTYGKLIADSVLESEKERYRQELTLEKARADEEYQNLYGSYKAKRGALKARLDAERAMMDEATKESQSKKDKVELAEFDYENLFSAGTIDFQIEGLRKLWEARLAAADDVMRPSLEKKMKEELSALQFENVKSKINWDAVFGDLSSQSTGNIMSNLKMVREYLDMNRDDLGIDEIRDLEEAITSMNNTIADRNPFLAIVTGASEMASAKEQYADAAAEYKAALQTMEEADREYDALREELQAKVNEGQITEEQMNEALAKADAKRAAATARLTNSLNALNTAQRRMTQGLSSTSRGLSSAIGLYREGAAAIGDMADLIGSDAMDAFRTITDVLGGVADLAMEVMSGLTDAGIDLIGNVGDVATATTEGVQGTSEAAAESIKAAENASVILLIIKAVIKAISLITSIIKANQEANENAAKATYEYKLALQELARAQALAATETSFGSDAFAAYATNIRLAGDSMNEYNGILAENEKRTLTVKNGWQQALKALLVFTDIANPKNLLDSALSSKGAGLGEKLTYDIASDMRSGWQKFWNSKKNIEGFNFADNMLDNGMVDGDKLKAFYDAWGDGMNKEQKRIVEQALDQWEMYKESLQGVTDYMKDLFGSMGNSIQDSLVAAFQNGESALYDLEDVAADVAQHIIEDFAYAIAIQPLVDQAQKAIDELNDPKGKTMTQEERMKKLIAITDQLIDGVEGAEEVYDAILQEGKDYAASKGMKTFEGTDEKASARGIAQASQDSVDELNGRATAIQGHTFSIMTGTQELVSMSGQMLQRLVNIDMNTSRLEDIESYLARMANHGVTMR